MLLKQILSAVLFLLSSTVSTIFSHFPNNKEINMLLKQISSVVLFLFLSTVFTTTVFAQKVSEATPKRIPATEFMIFPYDGVPSEISSGSWGDLADIEAVMKDIFDCGFNATMFMSNGHIKYALPHNLSVIFRDSRVNPYVVVTPEKTDEIVQTVLNEIVTPEERKVVHFFQIKDEPHSSLFPRLGVWANAITKQNISPCINLFPECTSATNWGTKNYEEYVDSFVKTCQPHHLSYDNYSLYNDNEFKEDRFYNNLEIIRKKSIQYNIPFWNVILGNTHFHYAEPSETTFSIQVYSTLAYGGKGIGYYTYYPRPIGNYRLAPIDPFGYRTKTWNAMRYVNLQIHSLAPVYCQLKSVNVFHVQNVPTSGQGKNSSVHIKSIDNYPFLVGEFVDPNGKPYVLVVNKNLQSSVELNIAFKKEGKVMVISPYNKGKLPFEGEQCWLAPGAGVLLTVE
jgi:hypothetical protein